MGSRASNHPPPDQRHEPARHDDQGQRSGDDADDDGGDEESTRRRPRADPTPGEHGGAQDGRREKERGEDRREGPVVAHAAQEEIGLDPVVLPPDPVGVTTAAPEARRVVPLEQPPAGDRDERDEHELGARRGEVRAAGEAGHQRVDEQHVAGPDDRREPLRDDPVAPEQQRLGAEDDGEAGPPVERNASTRGSRGTEHASRPGRYRMRARSIAKRLTACPSASRTTRTGRDVPVRSLVGNQYTQRAR